MPSNQTLPLERIRVADFTWAVAGPVTTKLLALYGADVIKIETNTRPDNTRIGLPFLGKPGRNRSAYFGTHNVSKSSITLNLNHLSGRDLARRLVACSDIVMENFSSGQMASWDLGFETLRRIKPDLIMLSSSTQGQTGPYAKHPGAGTQLQALLGFNTSMGWPDRMPIGPAMPYPDMIMPLFTIIPLMGALERRATTGQGSYIDLAQYEAGLHLMHPALLEYSANGHDIERRGNRSRDVAPQGVYRCRDLDAEERWCAVTVTSGEEWQALCGVIGRPELAADPRYADHPSRLAAQDELDRIIEKWTRTRTAEEVAQALQDAGVPAGIVANGRDMHQDPQLRHRGHFVTVDSHGGPFPADAPSFRISGLDARFTAPPAVGQHNGPVLKDLLGLTDSEYDRLVEEGAIN